MTVHSKIGASSMYRWSACPGSVRLSEGIESKSSKYAEEGTYAHEVAAQMLLGKTITETDPEILEAVTLYAETIRADFPDKRDVLVEHSFDLSSLYPGLFGTADCVLFDPKASLLRVYDYKHGSGIAVEVENNSQLKYYALGALISTKFPCKEIEIVIIQPRCSHPDGPVRRHRISSIELIDFAADLVEYAKATEDENAPLSPGDHCRFCPAAGICPALHSTAITQAQAEFSPLLSYDPEKLSKALTWLPALEAYIKSVREFAYQEASHGRIPPGYKLVQKRNSRRWKIADESELVEELRSAFKLPANEFYEHTIKSPAQVEKILSKEGKKMLSEFVISESSGQTLALESDKRVSAKPDALADFTVIEDN